MHCIICDVEHVQAVVEESFDCTDCGALMTFGYYLCPKCGWMWRTLNGEVIDGSVAHMEDIPTADEFVNDMFVSEFELDEMDADSSELIFENLQREMAKIDKVATGSAGMSDYVHNCLRCQSVVHEESPGKFKCGDCGFEWEIFDFNE